MGDFPLSLSLKNSCCSIQTQRVSAEALSASWCPLLRFELHESKLNIKTVACLVALQILILFPNLPITIYFSGSSNNCYVHSIQVLQLQSVREIVVCTY